MAREASKQLREKRAQIIAKPGRRRSIPFPGCTEGKQDTEVRGPRDTVQHGPSLMSNEVDVNDVVGVSEQSFDEMEDFYKELHDFEDDVPSEVNINMQDFERELGDSENDDPSMVDSDFDTYIDSFTDYNFETDVEGSGSSMTEPDEYDLEMAKAEEDGLFNRTVDQQVEPSLEYLNASVFNLVGTVDGDRQKKREWESESSPEFPTIAHVPGDADRNGKRRKLEIGTKSSEVPPPGLRKKANKARGGKLDACNLFCRSSCLAAVFQAAIAVGALDSPSENSSEAQELDALDMELLGEESSTSQPQSSVNEDFKAGIAEALYPTVGHEDLRVANAAANLLDIHQGNSNVSVLDSADRETLKDAFGKSDELQPSVLAEEKPSPFEAILETTRSSDHYMIKKRPTAGNGYKIKRYDKPIGPSREFRSFFATRRLRKDVLLKDQALWNEEDEAFILSGQKIAEPGSKLGAEFVAKYLLDVCDTASLSSSGTTH